MKTTINRWTDPDGNQYHFKDEVARAQNRELINKISIETADRKVEVNTERKRIDNLIATGTAQTQEIGKNIVSTSQGGTPITINYLGADIVYDKMFNNIKSKDDDFISIPYPQRGYVAKILKPGLYNMKFVVNIKRSAGLPEIPMRIMLNSSNSLDGDYVILKTEYLVFPATTSGTIFRNVEFIFAIDEPTYIKLSVTNVCDGSGSFSFSVGDCQITVIDWKGKQSADLSELHDLRIGVDGTVYGTAGEAVRSQTSGTPKNLIPADNREFEMLGITVKREGHKISLSGTATDNGEIRLASEAPEDLGMKTGKTYYAYDFPPGTTVTFLSGESVCGKTFLTADNNTFEVPEGVDRLWFRVTVKYKDALNYTGMFKVCDREYKTYQEQIDEANAKIEALQAIITKLATAPTLTADTNGNLQITENEEG